MIKSLSKFFKSILFYFKADKNNCKLKKLNNTHVGEECYIFGDGISLKYFDLSLFNDKPSIVSNNFIFHKDFEKLDVKYYSIYEPYWFLPFFVSGFKGIKFLRNLIQKKHLIKFKAFPEITFFSDISNSIKLKGNNIIYLGDSFSKKYIPYHKKINILEGSLRLEISLAIFLGFKKAYLIGHDYTHKNPLTSHFYERGKGIKNKSNDWNKDFFEIAKEYIDIITVTLDCESNTLKSTTYKKLTGDIPIFKENTEIVDEGDLESLSSWPGYKI